MLGTSANPPKPPFSPVWIPLVNIPASDVSLRPEFSTTLSHAGLRPQQLITLDDLGQESNLESSLPPDRTQWILVDHNALQGELGRIYSQRVVECIDHHRDEGTVPHNTGSEPRLISPAGSCTSHVVAEVQEQWTSLPRNASIGGGECHPSQGNAEAAKLAMASVLIDTVNLTALDKITEHDKKAAQFLRTMLHNFDQDAFYDEINAAKQDIGSLCLRIFSARTIKNGKRQE